MSSSLSFYWVTVHKRRLDLFLGLVLFSAGERAFIDYERHFIFFACGFFFFSFLFFVGCPSLPELIVSQEGFASLCLYVAFLLLLSNLCLNFLHRWKKKVCHAWLTTQHFVFVFLCLTISSKSLLHHRGIKKKKKIAVFEYTASPPPPSLCGQSVSPSSIRHVHSVPSVLKNVAQAGGCEDAFPLTVVHVGLHAPLWGSRLGPGSLSYWLGGRGVGTPVWFALPHLG